MVVAASVECGHRMGNNRHNVHMEDNVGKAEVRVIYDDICSHHSRDHAVVVVAVVSVNESV